MNLFPTIPFGTDEAPPVKYPWKFGITASVFWVGEVSDASNDFIPNHMSSWDSRWLEHFGGIDDPEFRNGFFPSRFTPQENPFYFALPFNDLDAQGERKSSAINFVPWAKDVNGESRSMLKNRWIRIKFEHKEVFAQWQDCGPALHDDVEYVFGNSRPSNTFGLCAGLDVSPAVQDYLGFKGSATIDWQFVDEEEVPSGPWRDIVTTSGICWE
jgi:hypothetical protein